jgi:hypothetical protein
MEAIVSIRRGLVATGLGLTLSASCDLPPYIPPYEAPEVIDTDVDTSEVGDCNIQPTLSDLDAKYFALSCVFGGCHEASSREGGLNMEADDLHAELVNVPAFDEKAGPRGKIRVIPFDAENSFLVEKLEGRQARDEGNLMPDGTDVPIDPQCRIKLVREWIDNGALDN